MRGKIRYYMVRAFTLLPIVAHINGTLYSSCIFETPWSISSVPVKNGSFSFYRNPGADMMLRKEEINYSLLKNTRLFHFGSESSPTLPIKAVFLPRCCNIARTLQGAPPGFASNTGLSWELVPFRLLSMTVHIQG